MGAVHRLACFCAAAFPIETAAFSAAFDPVLAAVAAEPAAAGARQKGPHVRPNIARLSSSALRIFTDL